MQELYFKKEPSSGRPLNFFKVKVTGIFLNVTLYNYVMIIKSITYPCIEES